MDAVSLSSDCLKTSLDVGFDAHQIVADRAPDVERGPGRRAQPALACEDRLNQVGVSQRFELKETDGASLPEWHAASLPCRRRRDQLREVEARNLQDDTSAAPRSGSGAIASEA